MSDQLASHQPPGASHSIFNYAIFVALALECVVLAAATDSFLTTANLTNVIRQNAFTAILAAGMTFVILIAGIDLSVGSVVGLSGVLCADALARGHGLGPALATGIMIGILVGFFNGVVTTSMRIPSFVVTLATMLIVRGAAFRVHGCADDYGAARLVRSAQQWRGVGGDDDHRFFVVVDRAHPHAVRPPRVCDRRQ